MLKEFSSREAAGNLSGRDKQVPAVKDCRFTQTAFGTVVHDSSGKWLGQYETEDAAIMKSSLYASLEVVRDLEIRSVRSFIH